MNWIKVFAPATVANVGPGFDVLGMAIEGWGDTVEARRSDSGVSISEIVSDYPIPKSPEANTASIATIEVLRELGNPGGVELRIKKGLPPGSGLGSSAASAAAGAFACNYLYGNKLTSQQLIDAATNAEESVSGRYADNTSAAILGSAVLVKSVSPVEIIRLGSINELKLIVVTPQIKVLTKEARATLPEKIALKDTVKAMANTSAVATAFLKDDYNLFVNSLEDVISEPIRKKVIPGYDRIKKAAIYSGADGFIISGSGPTLCAFSNKPKEKCESILKAMESEIENTGLSYQSMVTGIDRKGTRLV